VATIVHAADLHIDSGPLIHVARATRRAVTRLVELVLTEHADVLVISGDVFDRAADSAAAGRFFASEMGRLGDAGVPVMVAAGNHDVVCPHATAYSRNVRWFPADAPASFVLDDIGVAMHGQGLADPVEASDLSVSFPAPVPGYVNVGVLHTSLEGGTSKTICAPTSVSRLAGVGYHYWALGHVHQRWVVATDPWIVYPGNLQGRTPAEFGPKGATVITTAPGAITSVEHRDLAGGPLGAAAPRPGRGRTGGEEPVMSLHAG
jgi:exonuclease SbcD